MRFVIEVVGGSEAEEEVGQGADDVSVRTLVVEREVAEQQLEGGALCRHAATRLAAAPPSSPPWTSRSQRAGPASRWVPLPRPCPRPPSRRAPMSRRWSWTGLGRRGRTCGMRWPTRARQHRRHLLGLRPRLPRQPWCPAPGCPAGSRGRARGHGASAAPSTRSATVSSWCPTRAPSSAPVPVIESSISAKRGHGGGWPVHGRPDHFPRDPEGGSAGPALSRCGMCGRTGPLLARGPHLGTCMYRKGPIVRFCWKKKASMEWIDPRDGNGYPVPLYPAGKNPIRVRIWD